MNWDDLRVARAVFEAGSYAAASTRLRINETTVARRLARLQDDLGFTLFEAVDGVRKPTARCEELVTLAAMMADQVDRIERLDENETGLVGRRRVATTDSIASEVFGPDVAPFLAAHPGLALEFLVSTQNVNFSRWEADIAVRYGQPEAGDFLISRLADLQLYFCEPAAPTIGQKPVVCAYPEDLDMTPESRFLEEKGLLGRARCTTKNVLVVRKLVRSGMCSAVLPVYLCRDLFDDRSIRLTELPQRRSVWLLVQPHLRNDPATRTVIDWIRSCFRPFG